MHNLTDLPQTETVQAPVQNMNRAEPVYAEFTLRRIIELRRDGRTILEAAQHKLEYLQDEHPTKPVSRLRYNRVVTALNRIFPGANV